MKIELNHPVILTYGKDLISFLYIKNDKQLSTIDQYLFCPFSEKYLKKILFNKIYNFLLEKKLLNPNQSEFRPSDSCINQLLAITHEIFEAFDCNPSLEVSSVLLDISKAFEKVWHEGLLYKLKSMGIPGDVPQGSILGPLLFLLYINDLPNGLKSNAILFADDTSLLTIVKDKNESANILNDNLQLISNWTYE